ncbi:hypothetical protein [Nocardia brasiliensis]|uniref:hypothetical protein n=1 Tax=Nocardia brasiliensis TaxID=37326 RepID=UPI002456FE26|nr:hypothetical protein [Nocardia brasiliensis]
MTDWTPTFALGGRDGLDPMALYETAPGRWAHPAPTHCRNGHALGPNRVLVASAACLAAPGGFHRTYYCRTPDCGHTIYVPAMSEACVHAEFDGRSAEEKA